MHHVIHNEVDRAARDRDGDEDEYPTHRTSVLIPFEIAVTPQRPQGNPAGEFGFGADKKQR